MNILAITCLCFAFLWQVIGASKIYLSVDSAGSNAKIEGIDLVNFSSSMYSYELIDVKNARAVGLFYGDTVVIELFNTKATDKIGCIAYEFYSNDAARNEFMKHLLKKFLIPFDKTTPEKIIEHLNSCQVVKGFLWRELAENGYIFSPVGTTGSQNSWITGIVPQTKWCGKGTSALHFNDLGNSAKVDRCCRAHDFCPIKILAGAKDKNGTVHKYSTSHCDCDAAFYACLVEEKATYRLATLVGYFYFNLLSPDCIENYSRNIDEMKLIKNPKRWGEVSKRNLPHWMEEFTEIHAEAYDGWH